MIENQYINIFTQHRKAIDDKSALVLNAMRDTALASFKKLGFPHKAQEDYHHSDIVKAFETDYGLNINRLKLDTNPYTAYHCDVPNLSSNLYFLVNDSFNTQDLPQVSYPKGVFVGGLKDFAEQQPDICAKYYGQIAELDKNGIVSFNTMFAQDGFVVYVPDNVIMEHPIQLTNLLASKVDLLVNRRILIIAGKNAEVKILSCDHTVDKAKFLLTQVTEIMVDENARVEFYELEENTDLVTRLASTYVHQEQSSFVVVNNMTLHCGYTRNNYNVKLAGQYAETTVAGMVIADKAQHVDNFAFLDHAVPNCHSTQLFKYVLQDTSVGVFCGRILVEKDAQKTIAYQTNRNLCSSPDAKMFSKPQLEIYADDVKCSHGLTTGQLDEEALFYMRSRGIPEKDARFLLMQAFTSDVIDLVHLDSLKDRLHQLVEQRFKGETVRCGGCISCQSGEQ